MNNSKSENRSPLKFFLIVFGLSIPLWIIDLMIDAKRTSWLNFSVIDIITAFIPLIAGCILIYKEEQMASIKDLKIKETEETKMNSSLDDITKKLMLDINPQDFEKTWLDFFKENFVQIVLPPALTGRQLAHRRPGFVPSRAA